MIKRTIRLVDGTEFKVTNVMENYNKQFRNIDNIPTEVGVWQMTFTAPFENNGAETITDALTPDNMATIKVTNDGAVADTMTGYVNIVAIDKNLDEMSQAIMVRATKEE